MGHPREDKLLEQKVLWYYILHIYIDAIEYVALLVNINNMWMKHAGRSEYLTVDLTKAY